MLFCYSPFSRFIPLSCSSALFFLTGLSLHFITILNRCISSLYSVTILNCCISSLYFVTILSRCIPSLHFIAILNRCIQSSYFSLLFCHSILPFCFVFEISCTIRRTAMLLYLTRHYAALSDAPLCCSTYTHQKLGSLTKPSFSFL